MQKLLKLNKIGLGRASSEEIQYYAQMPCDPEIAELDPPTSKCINPTTFLAYRLVDDEVIGATILYNYHASSRSIEYGARIWNRENWNKGYGVEMTLLTCDYAFNSLGMNTVNLKVIPANTRAIKCYETSGFRHMRYETINGYVFTRMVKRRQ